MNSHFSPVAVLLIRWTALLTLAWATHMLVRNRHPRWRLILWRSVLCFVMLMPFARIPIFKIPLRPTIVWDFKNREYGCSLKTWERPPPTNLSAHHSIGREANCPQQATGIPIYREGQTKSTKRGSDRAVYGNLV
jgi:hypothetical protein